MCGISGILNKHPQNFDYSSFCVLGIANDARGGDSCGIFIDGEYEYGVDKQKYFQNFFLTSPLLNNTIKSKIALLHCRKASIGAVNKSNAQPVIIEENEEVKFVVLHNGTIHNYEELAKKYIPDVDIKDLTDSQVMTRIFYYKGYDVLSEYIGGAVFVIVDYRTEEPTMLLYKGASKKNSYSASEEEERPLYYTCDNDELIFSSIGQYLLALRPYTDTYSLKPNCLCQFDGEQLKIIKTIDRSKVSQTMPTTVTYYQHDDDYYGYSKYLIANSEDVNYKFNGKLAHGVLFIGAHGRILNANSKDSEEVWFFNGISMKSYSCFRFLSNLKARLRLRLDEFVLCYENLIRYLSLDNIYNSNGVYLVATSPTKSEPFTGTNQLIGNYTINEFKDGKKVSSNFGKGAKPLKEKLKQEIGMNFKQIKLECGL